MPAVVKPRVAALLGIAAAFVLSLAGTAGSAAAELIMFRRAGCPYCLAWDRAVGAGYPHSDLGARLPLRTVDLDRPEPVRVALVRPVRYTPTFVVARDGRELGRIEGYPGEAFFWGLLERIAEQLPEEVSETSRAE